MDEVRGICNGMRGMSNAAVRQKLQLLQNFRSSQNRNISLQLTFPGKELYKKWEEEFDEMEQSLTCRSTHSLIEEFTAEGDLNALEEVWLESVEEYKSKLGPHHYRTREAMNALAAIHIQQDHPEKAERLYLEVLKSSRDALGSKHVESIRAYYNLGETMLKTKKFHQANVWLLSCFLSQQDLLGIHHPDTLLTLRYLISSQAGCGKYIEAERLLKSTLDKLFLSLEANPVHIIDFSYLLCDIYYAVGRFEEAIALCQDCIEMSKVLGVDSTHLLDAKQRFERALTERNCVKHML